MSLFELIGLAVIMAYAYHLWFTDRRRARYAREGEARCNDAQDEQSMYNDLRGGG